MKLFKKKKYKIPYGIRNISSFTYLGLIGIIFIHWLVLSSSVPSFFRTFQFIFKSLDFVTPVSIFFSIIAIFSLTIVIVGFKKRGLFYWKFSWIWFVLVSFSNFVFVITMFIRKDSLFSILAQVLTSLLGGYFAYYIYHRKDFYQMKSLPEEFQ